MTPPRSLQVLQQVVSLRERERERIGQELARQQAQWQRHQHAAERLESLCAQSGPSGTLHPALSANCAEYKQAVLALAHVQREQAGQHEVQMDATRQALRGAMQRHGAMEKTLHQRMDGWSRQVDARARKQQDELASQVWLRGRPCA